MPEIITTTAAQGWIDVSRYILKNGESFGGLTEVRNLSVVIRDFGRDEDFDKMFRRIFGDERIDWAKAVTFIEPTNGNYKTLPPSEKKDSYWGRLIEKFGFNQVENSIKKLSEGKNIKTCQMLIFGPQDVKKFMGQPCLLSINCTPRNGKLYLNGVIRSNAVSKAGYADYSALVEMGLFLAKRSKLKLEEVTIFSHTAHIRKENGELKNTQKLLELVDREAAKTTSQMPARNFLINLPYEASTNKYSRYFPLPLNLLAMKGNGDILLDLNRLCFDKKKEEKYKILDTAIAKIKNKKAGFILNCGDYPADGDKWEYYEYFIKNLNRPVTLFGPYLLFMDRIKALERQGFEIEYGQIFDDFHETIIPTELLKQYPLVNGKLKVNINLTQGCPRKCSYCPVGPIYGHHYEIFPLNEVLAKIYHYYREGVRFFNFIDDNISASPKVFYRFLKALKSLIKMKKMKGVVFQSQEGLEVQALSHLKICQLLKETNWVELKVGLENISPRFLKLVNKPHAQKLHLIDKALKNFKRTGLAVTAYYLLGLDENREDVLENYKFIAKHKLGLRINILRPYEGTKFFKMNIKRKLSDSELRELKSLGYAIAWAGNEKGVDVFDEVNALRNLMATIGIKHRPIEKGHIFTGKVYIGFATSKLIKVLRFILDLDSSYKVEHDKEKIVFEKC